MVYWNNRERYDINEDTIPEAIEEIIDSYEGVLNDGYVAYLTGGNYILFCIPHYANCWSDDIHYYIYKDTPRQQKMIKRSWQEFEEIKAYYENKEE